MSYSSSVCTFVIVGQQDHPIYEVDLTGPKEVRGAARLRAIGPTHRLPPRQPRAAP